uniref:peptide-methionine (S)-S-oxide reductase n=1 Tax=Hirondellea gigas TaxID=1518452 RepID=A0A2P2I045_9CRUS
MDFDPQQTDYNTMLDMFWKNHDPSSKCSRQYMSAIFYHTEEQKNLAQASKKLENSRRNRPVTTSILPANNFYVAEDYHQKYLLQRHPMLCNMLDLSPCGDELVLSHVAARLNGYVGGFGCMTTFEEEWPKLNITEKCAAYIRKAARNNKSRMC